MNRNRHTIDRRFYLGIGLLVSAICVAGFAPSLVMPSTRTVPLPMTPLVMTHAIVATAWLLLFLLQVGLVSAGRVAAHRRLGIAGVLLVVLFTVTGWLTVVEEARRGFDLSGDLVARGTTSERAVALGPLIGVVLFAIPVGAAVWLRTQPELHKRLMVLALIGALTPAPLSHLVGHWPALDPWSVPIIIGSMFCLLLLQPAYDRWSRGSIHPLSLWGGAGVFMVLNVFLGVIVPSAAWRAFTEWLLAAG